MGGSGKLVGAVTTCWVAGANGVNDGTALVICGAVATAAIVARAVAKASVGVAFETLAGAGGNTRASRIATARKAIAATKISVSRVNRIVNAGSGVPFGSNELFGGCSGALNHDS